MSVQITDECINCGACAVECPVEAVYEPGKTWKYDGKFFEPLSQEHFFIVIEICNDCIGFDKKKCVEICPMDAIKEKM